MSPHNPAGKPDWTAPPPSGERPDAARQNHALQVPDFYAAHAGMTPVGRNACKIAVLQSCEGKDDDAFVLAG